MTDEDDIWLWSIHEAAHCVVGMVLAMEVVTVTTEMCTRARPCASAAYAEIDRLHPKSIGNECIVHPARIAICIVLCEQLTNGSEESGELKTGMIVGDLQQCRAMDALQHERRPRRLRARGRAGRSR
jgi:hypothetical protein